MISPINYEWVIYKEIKELQEISLNKLFKNKTWFLPFSQSLPKNNRLNMISLIQCVYKCFPTQDNLSREHHQRHSILKLSFWFPKFLSLETLLKTWRMKHYIVLRSRENLASIFYHCAMIFLLRAMIFVETNSTNRPNRAPISPNHDIISAEHSIINFETILNII